MFSFSSEERESMVASKKQSKLSEIDKNLMNE
jgi:hypothetical protein